ncbi:PEP-CTERM/exosortase system-associated acyltransferase [Corallincola luteus]|uniref:PEP-CTERM/exosortase system-associated acyltransferase n=1 Tax=Corallincola luteus TaxID=1775177 RepID=A0ABY2AMP8_9GAMM|nr:PEP-CTERM/exosortase system-associated acyltransferase [Corallincola luteus]TCI04473.1 PEP-CTERM/exosortase system-associated acyltransferase [Corallincola luteus]
MAAPSLAENFDRYFGIRYAKNPALKNFAYRIRHQVYAQELGWEAPNQDEIETDSCDPYAHVCLLEHKTSGQYAGTIRLVIPPAHAANQPLPFEQHCLQSCWRSVIDPESLERGTFGEISRLAVPDTFRRRQDEKGKPFVLGESSTARAFTEEERRNFPNIAIGLYLAAIAMVDICHHQHVFVMMEPRLQRHLMRFGLPFEQSGEAMEYHGTRALYMLPKAKLTRYLSDDIQELYDLIKAELNQQLTLIPFCPTMQ